MVTELEPKEEEPEEMEPEKPKQESGSDGKYLCYVCGEKAGKHSYYGGQVCASCRAFFRWVFNLYSSSTFHVVNLQALSPVQILRDI